MARDMPAYRTADRLYEAADLIRDAARILDEVVVCSPQPTADRIEAVPGTSSVDAGLALAIRNLADAIQAEYEAAEAERERAETEGDLVASKAAFDRVLDAQVERLERMITDFPEPFSPEWFAAACGMPVRDQKGAA